jgi:hypothetical protein
MQLTCEQIIICPGVYFCVTTLLLNISNVIVGIPEDIFILSHTQVFALNSMELMYLCVLVYESTRVNTKFTHRWVCNERDA